MNLSFDVEIANNYTSASQKARVLTENWVANQIYCPSCGDAIYSYSNNHPVADFYCKKCIEDFELKSKKGKFGKKVSAGAYTQMIKRVDSLTKPNLFFMSYLETLAVNDFFVVPKYFFITEIIEKRKALADNAQRAGWIGSNILFSKIPKAGQIFYIKNGQEVAKNDVLEKWRKTLFLKQIKKSEEKGWILDIMNYIDALNKEEFFLKDVYQFEKELGVIHPNNRNIKPKIRQQLQFLRDKGYLEFVTPGKYRLK
ncbi:MAG: restriction endonuclease [Candidatus Pacebacteria bacterium]|nr:restriction endonuclease [Candidatus Paceibacterota bacterium]